MSNLSYDFAFFSLCNFFRILKYHYFSHTFEHYRLVILIVYLFFRYAISRLKQAPDEDLMLYLLQLVQALKYENFDEIKEGKLIDLQHTCLSIALIHKYILQDTDS